MSKVVNTKFGDRGLVSLPPVKLEGSKSPVVNTIIPITWAPPPPPKAVSPSSTTTESTMAAPQQSYPQWYGAPQQSYGAMPQYQLQPSVYGGPGNFVPQAGMIDPMTQQAVVGSMQGYGYGQWPMVGGNPQMMGGAPQMPMMGAPQMPMMGAPQMPMMGAPQMPMGMQPQYPMMPYQMFQQNFPTGQLNQSQEKHIYYGPDGQVLPGPPPGFVVDDPKPRNMGIPDNFAVEGVLDYGRLRSVNLLDKTKRFPKLPEYLIKELLVHYKQYRKCYVKIRAQNGGIHVHATPFIDKEPAVSDTQYEYVPVYLDENDQIIGRADDRGGPPIGDRGRPPIVDRGRPPIVGRDRSIFDDSYRGREITRHSDHFPPPVQREFYHQPVYEDGEFRDPISRSDRDRIPIYDRGPDDRHTSYDRDPVYDRNREPITYDRNREPITYDRNREPITYDRGTFNPEPITYDRGTFGRDARHISDRDRDTIIHRTRLGDRSPFRGGRRTVVEERQPRKIERPGTDY